MLFYAIQAKIYISKFVWTPKPIAYAVCPLLPVLLLATAAMLNLNNWVSVYLKVEEVVSYVDDKIKFDKK
jgi:hypothetical protein